jgi:DnaJ-class molecular chaperone
MHERSDLCFYVPASHNIPERQETITVKIPACARDGTRLRFEGKGRPGKIGEPSGDFYILAHVK